MSANRDNYLRVSSDVLYYMMRIELGTKRPANNFGPHKLTISVTPEQADWLVDNNRSGYWAFALHVTHRLPNGVEYMVEDITDKGEHVFAFKNVDDACLFKLSCP